MKLLNPLAEELGLLRVSVARQEIIRNLGMELPHSVFLFCFQSFLNSVSLPNASFRKSMPNMGNKLETTVTSSTNDA